jgi:2-methylcitrate dehydratase
LIDRTTIVEDASCNAGYPKGIPNDITITCADGTTVSKRVDFPRGHAGNPMTDDEVVAKFRRMADCVLTEQTAAEVLGQAWDLDKLAEVTPLFTFEVIEPDRAG